MAEIAAAHCGAPVTFELSIANVDKPPLDFIEIADRLAPLGADPGAADAGRHVCRKGAARARVRVRRGHRHDRADRRPSYYGGDAARRDAAIAAIAAQGCRFLVFGRQLDGRFCTLADLDIPAALRAPVRRSAGSGVSRRRLVHASCGAEV